MKNSKRLEKSRGIVAFATNTGDVDYVSIATKTLELAGRVLDLPYTLITDLDQSSLINTRYSIDSGNFVEWKNFSRYQAYELSPYDETLVIDADYIVQDRNLLVAFDIEFDYLLQRCSRFLPGPAPTDMGPTSLPLVWATVFLFRKTERAKMFFALVKRIQDNYGYYRELFNIEPRNFRNDCAFAIADTILNGYALSAIQLPSTMLTIDAPITAIGVNEKQFVVRAPDAAYVVPRANLHIMSKQFLMSPAFDKFIQDVTA